MKLDQLSYFVAAARLESVGKAARLTAISPSAISHSIASLEAELGVSLFLREKKRIRLTDQGRILLERAERVIAEVANIKSDLSAETVKLEGHFCVASTQSLAARFVTAAWSKLQAQHPKLELSLQVLGSRGIAAKAMGAEIDLGFCFGPVASQELRSQVLATEPFIVAVRKKHPVLKLGLSSRAAALANIPCAAPRSYPGKNDFEHPELERLGIRQRVDFVFETYDVAVQRVLHSDSWAFLPEWYVKRDRNLLEAVELPKWNAKVEILALWPAKRTLGRALSELCAAVKAEI
ncbi:MAG: LysR family transcriptional regulator [Bdellovibrionota bacterium]